MSRAKKTTKELEGDIQRAAEKFRNLSDGFPSSEEIKEDAKIIVSSYDQLIEDGNKIISELEDEISDLKEEVEELKDQTDKLESEMEDIKEKMNPFKCETLEEEMKIELFQAAMKKYTLVQLEEKLGNKFELM